MERASILLPALRILHPEGGQYTIADKIRSYRCVLEHPVGACLQANNDTSHTGAQPDRRQGSSYKCIY